MVMGELRSENAHPTWCRTGLNADGGLLAARQQRPCGVEQCLPRRDFVGRLNVRFDPGQHLIKTTGEVTPRPNHLLFLHPAPLAMNYRQLTESDKARNALGRKQRRNAVKRARRTDGIRGDAHNPMALLLGMTGELTLQEVWIIIMVTAIGSGMR